MPAAEDDDATHGKGQEGVVAPEAGQRDRRRTSFAGFHLRHLVGAIEVPQARDPDGNDGREPTGMVLHVLQPDLLVA